MSQDATAGKSAVAGQTAADAAQPDGAALEDQRRPAGRERVTGAVGALFADAVSGAASSWRRRSRRRAGRRRVAVVDIGSNSVRLVVYDGASRAPDVFFNEKSLCGLGAELAQTGRLSAAGRERALQALGRFRALLDGMDVDALQAVATAAVRDAADGPDFAAAASRRLGASIWVATGEDEATLAAQGVLFGAPDAAGVVADMGGGSMEIARLISAEAARANGRAHDPGGRVAAQATTPLGPLRLAGLSPAARDAEIARAIDAALSEPGAAEAFVGQPTLYALGGSWRALARAHMRRTDYPLKVLHGFELPLDEAIDAADWVSRLGPAELRSAADVSDRRAEVTPLAAASLAGLLRAARPDRMVLSAFGLREGLLWRAMTSMERLQDPLLSAAGEIEASQGRTPGYGATLWEWLRPVFALQLTPAQTRLAEAFCRLADAAWRAHPDYRAQASFELATRANFGGATHRDRLFIAYALLNRHKGGKSAARGVPALQLLPNDDRRAAAALGRAARLADAMSAGSERGLRGAELSADDAHLRLALRGRAAGLHGEAAGRRLEATAQALGLIADLRID